MSKHESIEQESVNMSYKVYTVEYLGQPGSRNHIAIFIEKKRKIRSTAAA
jgi:hypothetical protein